MKAAIIAGCVVLSVSFGASGAHAKPPVGVKHECPTAIDVDGNVLATAETHKCWERVNRLVNHSKRSGTGCAMVVSTCPSCNGGKGGWQISQTGNRAACVIIIPTDDYIREHHQDPKSVIRHETGHCNGWPADHPRGVSKWEWVEK
jgi:hypothetical protein